MRQQIKGSAHALHAVIIIIKRVQFTANTEWTISFTQNSKELPAELELYQTLNILQQQPLNPLATGHQQAFCMQAKVFQSSQFT